MATLVLRGVKGSELTYVELDANFTNLNAEVGGKQAAGTYATPTDISNERSAVTTLTNKTISAASNTITTAASGNLVATTLNAALAELQTDIDTRALASTATTLTGAQTLTNKTISAASNTITVDGANAVGFREIPQVSQSAAYTTVFTDSGKHILHPSADTTARIFTIPANASVAYPIGTALTFVNQAGAGVLTIAIANDVMRLAGLGTTGSRTLAANGIATAIKITATEWLISGSGLT